MIAGIAIIAALTYMDMWNVNKRYLNDDDFVSKRITKKTFTKTPADQYILNDSNCIFKCAVVYYGIFLTTDFKYISTIDSLSQKMGFMTPRLSEPTSWNKNVPLMIVHVGKDFVPHSDESLTGFLDKAISQKVPFTLIHYATGIHGFDVYADDPEIREIIKNTLEFWKFYLKQ